MKLGRVEVGVWIAAYEQAWRTAGTAALRDLFTEDATYRMSPYEESVSSRSGPSGLVRKSSPEKSKKQLT
jgi:hypothetical protein